MVEQKKDFMEIYDKVDSKLATWKRILFNKSGRVTLRRSSPLYILMVCNFNGSSNTFETLDKKCEKVYLTW